MSESKPIAVRVTREMRDALLRHCKREQIECSTFIREVLMNAIGCSELAETMPPEGRQRQLLSGEVSR